MYTPPAERATQHPEKFRDLYNDLTTLNNNLKNLSTSAILIAEYFIGKAGKADDFESCIGKWTLGQRNANGQKLVVKTSFSATPPSNTNKATLQHAQTQSSTQTPTKYVA